MKNGSCAFTITQDICVAVPVEFGAVAAVGDSFVSCSDASDQDICTTCGQTAAPTANPTAVPDGAVLPGL